jgi:hypothetical protein
MFNNTLHYKLTNIKIILLRKDFIFYREGLEASS